jgi:hypothetical protein
MLGGKGEQTALMAMETKSHENSRASNPMRKGKRERTDSAIVLRGDRGEITALLAVKIKGAEAGKPY